MCHITLNRYAEISHLDEFEDHCLTLKNAPHAILACAAYETLVNEEGQACSTPDTPQHISDIRRITIKTSPDVIQDAKRTCVAYKNQVTPHLNVVYEYSRIY